jgi:hypothetical protein
LKRSSLVLLKRYEAIIAGVVEAIIAGAFLALKLKLCTSPFQVQH